MRKRNILIIINIILFSFILYLHGYRPSKTIIIKNVLENRNINNYKILYKDRFNALVKYDETYGFLNFKNKLFLTKLDDYHDLAYPVSYSPYNTNYFELDVENNTFVLNTYGSDGSWDNQKYIFIFDDIYKDKDLKFYHFNQEYAENRNKKNFIDDLDIDKVDDNVYVIDTKEEIYSYQIYPEHYQSGFLFEVKEDMHLNKLIMNGKNYSTLKLKSINPERIKKELRSEIDIDLKERNDLISFEVHDIEYNFFKVDDNYFLNSEGSLYLVDKDTLNILIDDISKANQ